MLMPSVTLQDKYVQLEPMTLAHIDDLYKAGQELCIWKWTTHNYCASLDATKAWVHACLKSQRLGMQQPFVIIDKTNNKIVGSSSYLNISLQHKAIEIGYTFLNPSAQKSYVNRRCKLLLLTHAFETLMLNRVALQTHEKNTRSRNAILGIGAQFEGIHRDDRIQEDGSLRSSAFYSVIKSEWPQVKSTLQNKLTIPNQKGEAHVCP